MPFTMDEQTVFVQDVSIWLSFGVGFVVMVANLNNRNSLKTKQNTNDSQIAIPY